jgi:hypothetical protein
VRNGAAAKALLCWSTTEREAWLDAVINDPLLPVTTVRLSGATSTVAVRKDRRRVEVLRAASRQRRTFKPDKTSADRV